jgi:hypothetical protein
VQESHRNNLSARPAYQVVDLECGIAMRHLAGCQVEPSVGATNWRVFTWANPAFQSRDLRGGLLVLSREAFVPERGPEKGLLV